MRLLIYSTHYQGGNFLDIQYTYSFGYILPSTKVINRIMIKSIPPLIKIIEIYHLNRLLIII